MPNAYHGFAALYDELMDDFDYERWADYYRQLAGRLGMSPKTLCDCACGTGSLSIRFSRAGIRVTAIDISEDMLRIASEKARAAGERILFSCQDMADFRVGRPVDCVVCGCDGINYLTDEGRVFDFFASARDALVEHGVIAFDFSTRSKFERMCSEGAYCEEREDVAYIWSNSFDESHTLITMDLTFFRQESGDLFRRFTERHVQRVHTPERLSEMLYSAGFTDVCAFGGMTFEAPSEEDARIHMAAVKR